jgi:hypothetical protein
MGLPIIAGAMSDDEPAALLSMFYVNYESSFNNLIMLLL